MKIAAELRRHPIVTAIAVVLLLAGLVAGALVGGSRNKVTYQSDGIVLLIPPGAGNPVATMNPFVNLNSSMAQLAQALTTQLSSPDVVTEMSKRAPSVTGFDAKVRYDDSVVNAQPTSQVQITVRGTDAQVVRDAVRQLMTIAGDDLKQMQLHAGVTDTTLADTVQLVAPTEPQVMPVSRARSAGLGGIAGLLIAVIIVGLAVGIGKWWRRKPGAGAGSADESAVTGDAAGADAEEVQAGVADAEVSDAQNADGDAAGAEPSSDEVREPAGK